MSRDNDLWIEELGARRESALSDLREALLRSLHRALANQTRVDDSFLEDVVQESILRILDKLGQFAGRSRFLTWGSAIAIRVAMGQLRKSHWKEVSLDDVMSETAFLPGSSVSSESTPHAQLERHTLVAAMQRVIEHELTNRQRTALLAELKGMPQDEIARHLGSNRNAIYKLTHDARKKIKERLEAAGYSTEDVLATLAN